MPASKSPITLLSRSSMEILPSLVYEDLLRSLFPDHEYPRDNLYLWATDKKKFKKYKQMRSVCKVWDCLLRSIFTAIKKVLMIRNLKSRTVFRARSAFEEGRANALICEPRMFTVRCINRADMVYISTELAKKIEGLCLRQLYLSERELTGVIKNLPNLRQLEISHCCAMNSLVLKSKSVEKLSLRHVHGLASLRIICPNLKELYISCSKLSPLTGGSGITNILIEAPLLSRFELDRCNYLRSISLDSEALPTLTVSRCSRFSRSFKLRADHVKFLELLDMKNLKSTIIQCPTFESIISGHPPNLKSVQVNRASVSAGTPIDDVDIFHWNFIDAIV